MIPAMMVVAKPLATISAIWSNIAVASPAVSGTNEDRTISWNGGGSRMVTNNWSSGGTLEYRINSGAWTTYTEGGAGFSLTSGQTVGWRYQPVGNVSATATVAVGGIALDAFTIQATGF